MHTCSTSTSPPSLVQKVWWRDGLDLQRDGAVQVVESFCSRASPTRSREGERERRAAGRLGGGGRRERRQAGRLGRGRRCGGRGRPQPSLYRGVGARPNPSPKPRSAAKGG